MSGHEEIGQLILELRNDAGLTQKQVADQWGVHQSRISRIEQGDVSATLDDYEKILKIIGTAAANRLSEVLRAPWAHLPCPSFRHPDLETLIEVERALERLGTFKQGPAVPQILAGQANLLYSRLTETGEFLLNLDHQIVYVGEIGVGKTTAACRQANLVLDPVTAHQLKGMLLDTGGGRTTLCEVVVQRGSRFGIKVDPLPDEEVYRLSAELCRSLRDQPSDTTGPPPNDFKPPEEVTRALRNMAALPRPARRKDGLPVVDPALELSNACASADAFAAEFAAKLTLWRRTRRSIEFDGSDEQAGKQWLRETFTAINNGRHPDFSLPNRISISVPFQLVADTPFKISLVDTRGVDGSAIRPDVVAQLKDRRSLSVLCATWGSAPDAPLQDLLRHIVETEVDPNFFSRVAVLVIARAGDALSMRHDSGDGAADVAEGYDIKCSQVQDALRRADLAGVSVQIFDAANDDPNELTTFLISKIGALRTAQIKGAHQTIEAVDEMLQNVEQAQAIATFGAVNNELTIFADRHATLKETRRSPQYRLISAVRERHARTVWAATRRAGAFWNFDVYQHLGDGAAADAKRRVSRAMNGLREIIKNKTADVHFEKSHSFLGQILDGVDAWEADFVRAARHHAVTLYRPKLEGDADLWRKCEARYGSGTGGYREEVASLIDAWFDEHESLGAELERRLQRAWKTSVLTPLRTAVGAGTSIQDDG